MDGLQAWSFGGAIITFLVPMIAFSAVALGLLILYTKPDMVPGRVGPGNRLFAPTANRHPGKPVSGDTKPEAPAESASAG